MMGKLADDLTQGLSEMAGVIPRVSHLLFATSHSVPDTHEFFVEASFIEIYNEKVRDLLDPTQSELKIRESPKMGVHITGLTKKHVQSSFGVGNVLNMGFQNRTVSVSSLSSIYDLLIKMTLICYLLMLGCVHSLQLRVQSVARHLRTQYSPEVPRQGLRRENVQYE